VPGEHPELSKDGRRLALMRGTAETGRTLHLLDAATFSEEASFPTPPDAWLLDWSMDGTGLYFDGRGCNWWFDLASARFEKTCRGPLRPMDQCRRDDYPIVARCGGRQLRLRDDGLGGFELLEGDAEPRPLLPLEGFRMGFSPFMTTCIFPRLTEQPRFSPECRYVVVGLDYGAWVVDVASGKLAAVASGRPLFMLPFSGCRSAN